MEVLVLPLFTSGGCGGSKTVGGSVIVGALSLRECCSYDCAVVMGVCKRGGASVLQQGDGW